ncbi:hypothetical protein ACTMTI_43450 [Nonomuraea sp. H19]
MNLEDRRCTSDVVAALADDARYDGNDEVGHKVWARIHTGVEL